MTSLSVLPQESQPQANPLVNVFNAVIDGVTQLVVNARDLHKFLKVGRDFTTWIKGRISQYVFVENVDYIIVENLSSPNRGSTKSRCQKMTDYHLTLDMAKELAMVENNEEGRKVRRYFIRCEKDLYKSDSQQREVLRQACEKLATGNMLISDAYIMVGEHFGYEGGIKDIPTPLLPQATAFVYEMILRLRSKPTDDNSDYNAFWRKVGLLEYHRVDSEMRKFRSNLEQLVRQFNVLHKTKGLIYDALMEQKVNCTTDPAEINAKAEAFIDKQLAMKF